MKWNDRRAHPAASPPPLQSTIRERGPSILILLLSMAAMGCSRERGEGGGDAATSAEVGQLRGVVRDVSGAPIGGAVVEAGGQQVITDEGGAFTIWDLEPADRVDVLVRAQGYSTGHDWARVVASETSQLLVRLLPGRTLTLSDARAGGVVEADDGFRVEFPPDALRYESVNGDLVEGPVSIMYAGFTEAEHFSAAPDLFTYVEGEGVLPLQSYGMVDVTLTQDGVAVALDGTAQLQFPLVEGAAALEGEVIPLYWYDEDRAIWVEEGEATVAGGVAAGDVSHFSTWNSDLAQTSCSCYRGRLVDEDGEPPSAPHKVVLVLTNGVYGKVSTETSQEPDTAGEFCVKTMPGATAELSVYGDLNYVGALEATPATGVSCTVGKTADNTSWDAEAGLRNWTYDACLLLDAALQSAGIDGSPGQSATACALIEEDIVGAPGDADGDGYISSEWLGPDCLDSDEDVHPGAAEDWCDAVDEDCDGNVADQDGDGFPNFEEGSVTSSCGVVDFGDEVSFEGVYTEQDCAPADAAQPQPWYLDCDGDGWAKIADEAVFWACDNDSDSAPDSPLWDAAEDCGTESAGWATLDADCADFYQRLGATTPDECPPQPEEACPECGACFDCDDRDQDTHPGGGGFVGPSCEVGVDRDCDCVAALTERRTTWYADADSDGYGDVGVTETGCERPLHYVDNSTDCDDTNPNVTDEGGDCDAAEHETGDMVVLASVQAPYYLAQDDDYVYWTHRNFYFPGAVYRVRKDGAEDYEVLYDDVGDPRGVAVADDYLYWVDNEDIVAAEKSGAGVLYRVSGAELLSTFEFVVGWDAESAECDWWELWEWEYEDWGDWYLEMTGFLTAVAVDDGEVYVTTSTIPQLLVVDSEDGGYIGAGADCEDDSPSTGVAVDSDDVYWTRGPSRASREDLRGSGLLHPEHLDGSYYGYEGLAVDDEAVYYQSDSALVRLDKRTGAESVLATWDDCHSIHWPFNVVVDDTHVYWLEQCASEVMRAPKDGSGASEVIYESDTDCLMSLVVDDDAVYWADCDDDDGAIVKWFK